MKGATMSDVPTDLVFTYTNHRGETAVRRVLPEGFRFGATQWHREPQWLLVAYDLDKGARRDFAWRDIRFSAPALDEDAVIRDMARAHDREAAAHMGEPSPWENGGETDALFVSERMAAMRAAFEAMRAALERSTDTPTTRREA